MKSVSIAQIQIGPTGALGVTPESENFSYIWRDASGVRWDNRAKSLFTIYNDISPIDGFKLILSAAKNEYGITLLVANTTIFINVPEEIRAQIELLN